MEKLGIYKIIGDDLVYCGCFASREEALEYLTEIKKMIDQQCNYKLEGEYVLVPMLHFDIKRSSTPPNQTNHDSI